jgi:hypothetical protein
MFMGAARARRGKLAVAVLLTSSVAVWSIPPASAAPEKIGPVKVARELGLQQVPKTDKVTQPRPGVAAANPMLALLPDPSKANLHGWKARVKDQSKARSTRVGQRNVTKKMVSPLVVREKEPGRMRGGNDTHSTAQLISKLGTARGKRSAARILGTLAPPRAPATRAPNAEDDGSIGLARDVAVANGGQSRTTGTIGDGPHGSAGDQTGDHDFYAIRGAVAGQRLSVGVKTPKSELDSVVILWDAQGNLVNGNDDGNIGDPDSFLTVPIPAAGDYFVSVHGLASLPEDPFDSGSGSGAQSEGSYTVTFGVNAADFDFYAVNLRAGDVLSGSVAGSGARLTVFEPSRREALGSSADASGLYPLVSPLAGGGNAVIDHVAATSGRHYVSTEGRRGNYTITLEAYRPGPEVRDVVQTIFLDFNGARVNTAIWGGPGVRQLSPLSAFMSRWGLKQSQRNALIDRIVATVKENLRRDYRGTGVEVRILNSRDHADPWGKPNVSRLVVGGTIPEAGVETIAIAQSIDPGNFDTAETGLVLLDLVSEPAEANPPASLNTYLKPGSVKVKFIGTALGNLASHEAGHYLGNWHVDQVNDVLNLMDQGGNFPLMYGVGRDGVGGTADDPDVDFGVDQHVPNEGFTGLEDTRARTGWALIRKAPPVTP